MRSFLVLPLAVLLATGCSAGHRGATPAPTTISVPDTAATTTKPAPPPPPLSARVILKTRTIRAGSSMTGVVVVQNRTGHALHPEGCERLFAIALGRGNFEQSPAWLDCLQIFTIPTGRSTYPVTLTASYLACTNGPPVGDLHSCTNQVPPPLPAGRYRATLVQSGKIVPTPPAITVRITER